jgi:hypothetical protein
MRRPRRVRALFGFLGTHRRWLSTTRFQSQLGALYRDTSGGAAPHPLAMPCVVLLQRWVERRLATVASVAASASMGTRKYRSGRRCSRGRGLYGHPAERRDCAAPRWVLDLWSWLLVRVDSAKATAKRLSPTRALIVSVAVCVLAACGGRATGTNAASSDDLPGQGMGADGGQASQTIGEGPSDGSRPQMPEGDAGVPASDSDALDSAIDADGIDATMCPAGLILCSLCGRPATCVDAGSCFQPPCPMSPPPPQM